MKIKNFKQFLSETIHKEQDKYVIYSKHGKKLGEFDTEQEALDRLKEIEYFKNKENLK